MLTAVLAAGLFSPMFAAAATINWTGATSTDWFTASNWSPAQVPTSGDAVVIDADATVSASGATSISFAALTLGDSGGQHAPTLVLSATENPSGSVVISSRAVLRQDTAQTIAFTGVTVLPGGVITHTANSTTRSYLVNLSVSGDFGLQTGAAIVMTGLGYGLGAGGHGGSGPGAGAFGGGGGGHGGMGGNGGPGTGGAAYDDVTNPTDLGSGGGGVYGGVAGGGGGAALIAVGGTLSLNGVINANGGDGYSSAGGSGGTVNITAGNLNGTGTILANGGIGVNGQGGGGGGRIAIVSTVSDVSNLFLQANAATGSTSGGAGVIARKRPGDSSYGLTIGDASFVPQSLTPLSGASPAFAGATIGNASIAFPSASTATVASIVIVGTASVSAGNLAFTTFEVQHGGVAQLAAQAASGGTLQVDGGGTFVQTNTLPLNLAAVTVQPGGVMTHAANGAVRAAVLNLVVSGDFTLPVGASVALKGAGYALGAGGHGGSGPGAGLYGGGGGGHGGVGGNGVPGTGGAAYDDTTNPTDLGSGGGGVYGGVAGNGGGAALISVGGTLTLNGSINANGDDGSSSAGGAGGTVNIAAATLVGTGSILANGGVGVNGQGGGGGGRIAIAVGGTDSSSLTVKAGAGAGSANGGAGVIARKDPGASLYSLTIGDAGFLTQSPTPIPGSAPSFASVAISNAAVLFSTITPSAASIGTLSANGSSSLTASTLALNGLVVTSTLNLTAATLSMNGTTLEVAGGGVLQLAASSISNAGLQVDAGGTLQQTNLLPMTFASAVVQSGGVLTHSANADTRTAILNLSVAGDFNLSAGAGIFVKALGYQLGAGGHGGSGPGAGHYGGGGGGHGGMGGNGSPGTGGAAYDDLTNPTDLGSGGGGVYGGVAGAGGGAALISVGGALALNGAINANGDDGSSSAGGAAGTVNITAATLTGTGSILANGGAGVNGQGGGGGGRVSITVTTSDGSNLSLQAKGGSGSVGGGAGTIARKGPGAVLYSLTIGDPSVASQSATPIPSAPLSLADLTVNRAVASFGDTLQHLFNAVTVNAGGTLTHAVNASSKTAVLNLKTVGDFVLQPGGVVSADQAGYAGGYGAGAGGSGSGGGHGGVGGSYQPGGGGTTYDSIFDPSDEGSGGGPVGGGGAGGGVVLLQVGGTLNSNGTITANGAAGSGGGGAGGTVNITAAALAGAGTVRADGGTGPTAGGGGGRVRLFYGTKAASWTLEANGGTGAASVGIGSVLDNGRLVNAPQISAGGSLSQLQQSLTSGQNLSASVSAQALDFSGATATGTLNATFSIAQMQLVSLQSGSFAGDGFFTGGWTLVLPSGDLLSGTWQGTAFLSQSPRQIVLNGAVLGGIRGVLEGVLKESSPGSGNFNILSAACSALQFGSQIGAASLSFSGNGSVQQSLVYSAVPLSLLQTSLTGPVSGDYSGNLETTFTLLRINDPANPFYGQGFFLPSYSATAGTGTGWAYAATPSAQGVTVAGVLEQPLRGLFEGALVLGSPQAAAFTLGRLDGGLPVRPILSITTTEPHVANPGAIDSYSITIRNDGYAAASGMSVVAIFPDWADFASASGGYVVYKAANWWQNTDIFDPTPFVRWDLPTIPPRSSQTLTYQSRVRLYVTGGPPAHGSLSGGSVEMMSTSWANQLFMGYPSGGTQ